MVPAFVYANMRPVSMPESQASSLIAKSIQRNISFGIELYATRPGGSTEQNHPDKLTVKTKKSALPG